MKGDKGLGGQKLVAIVIAGTDPCSWHKLLRLIISLIGPGLLFLGLLCSARAQTHTPLSPSPQLQWKTQLSSQYFENAFDQHAITGWGGLLKTGLRFDEHFALTAEAGFGVDRGSIQGLERTTDLQRNGLYLEHAALQWSPRSSFLLEAGSLNQDHLNNSLLAHDQSFPAVREVLTLPFAGGQWDISFQQAVPTSKTLRPKAGVKQPLPYLLTASLHSTWKWPPVARLQTHVTWFDFSRLPSAVADESRLYGNQVLGRGHAFRYSFSGGAVGGHLRFNGVGKTQNTLGARFLYNQKAPTGRNKALRYFAAVSRPFAVNYEVSFKWEHFTVQSDASPAYYNNRVLGHNNRRGWGATVTLKLPQVTLNSRYIESGLLVPNAHQSPHHLLYFSLETEYATL